MSILKIKSLMSAFGGMGSKKSPIYTPLSEARKELLRRWNDKELETKISNCLNGDLPECLKDEPHVALFRHITTVSGETDRLIQLSKEVGIKPISLEFKKDKFVAFNPDKYFLLSMAIRLNKQEGRPGRMYKIKISDIDQSQGKTFEEIKTLWGQDLVDFHHEILFKQFPELKDCVFDLSDWLNRNGARARLFYEKFMVLLLRNCILFESFKFTDNEGKFMKEVLLPAFKKVKKEFGVSPLIVQLAPDDFESNPDWWYPKEEVKDTIQSYILEQKQRASISR